MSRRPQVRARLDALVGGDLGGARQSLVALCLNSTTSFAAGAVLGAITGTFERYPGLLVLVPPAIGLRGNIFSTLGTRLSTAIHTGTFRMSARRDTVLGQNVSAAVVLTGWPWRLEVALSRARRQRQTQTPSWAAAQGYPPVSAASRYQRRPPGWCKRPFASRRAIQPFVK